MCYCVATAVIYKKKEQQQTYKRGEFIALLYYWSTPRKMW